MSRYSIVLNNAQILTPSITIPHGTIVTEGDKIRYVGEIPPPSLPEDARKLDMSGCIISPGLIDLHLHGAIGIDFTKNAAPEWAPALKHHTAQGTTAFLATLMSAPHSRLVDALQQIAGYCPHAAPNTARCLGIHMEGPYLNPKQRGIHRPSNLRLPSLEEIIQYIKASIGWLKMLTLAPELDIGQDIIRTLAEQKITIAAGHSSAGYEQTKRAIQAGLSYCVHTGNAMAPPRQREPGVMGALLEDENVLCEVIADGIHIHPGVLKLFYKIKGAAGLVLATDSSPLAGLPPGLHQWQKQTIHISSDRITNSEGKLAGSCLTMAQAVKNMLEWTGCTLPEALQMATLNPAKVLGLRDKGRLADGKDADLVVFKHDLTIKLVLIGGEIVWP